MKRLAVRVGVASAGLLTLTAVFTALAGAQDAVPTSAVKTVTEQMGVTPDKIVTGMNLLWVVIGAALVIFMQAGFALVETGFCRAKHAAHVVSTNFAIFGLGFVAFFIVGFGFMFGGYSATLGPDSIPVIGDTFLKPVGSWLIGSGADGTGILAWANPMLMGDAFKTSSGAMDAGILAFFLYMVAFMDTTATIPTGSMAERWKWSSFCVWGLFCGGLYYPLFGAMTWGGGWLSQLGNTQGWGVGYADFAGSGVVHAMGGVAALAGAIVLGPRIGKYGPDKKPRTLPGHHLPMAMLGTFILLFGWFGFNAASTFAATDVQFGTVALNTGLAAAVGAMMGMIWAYIRVGKPDPGWMVNGMLAGLVAITAPCAFVQPWAAALIGLLAAVIVLEAATFFENRGIDDPVGAIAVHGVGGLFGVLAVGLFADGTYGAGWNGTLADDGTLSTLAPKGLFMGGGSGQLISQALGCLTLCTVMFAVVFAFFKIQNALTPGGIRSKREDEIMGLDIPEMGTHAYPDFSLVDDSVDLSEPASSSTRDSVPV